MRASNVYEWSVGHDYYEVAQFSPIHYNWCMYSDEGEGFEVGGEIELGYDKDGTGYVNDFDGAFDLPKEIKIWLRAKNINVDF